MYKFPLGEIHRQAFPEYNRRRRATKIGEIIQSDLCWLESVQSLSGSLYYVLFQYDVSGFRISYLIKNTSETFAKFGILLVS